MRMLSTMEVNRRAKETHLAKVELCVLLVRNAFDLEKGCVGACVALAALVAENTPFGVETEEVVSNVTYRRYIPHVIPNTLEPSILFLPSCLPLTIPHQHYGILQTTWAYKLTEWMAYPLFS